MLIAIFSLFILSEFFNLDKVKKLINWINVLIILEVIFLLRKFNPIYTKSRREFKENSKPMIDIFKTDFFNQNEL